MHVDDLGEACVFALENWDPSAENAPKTDKGELLNFLNVGTGQDLKIRCLAEIIAENIEYKGNIIWDTSKPDGTPKKQLDVTRMTSLGWVSSISLLSELIQQLKSFIQTQIKNHFNQRIL